MKRKLYVLLLAIALLISACTKDSDNPATTVPTSSAEQETTTNGEEGKDHPPAEDSAWAQTATFYQIFVRSFYDSDGDGIGDFKGIAKKVDYLKELGVNAVWLMPIKDSTTYHGYDVVDYYNIQPDYGTMDDFEEMLKILHDHDIKVIIDFVANHSSSSNLWFKEALEDPTSKYRDFYYIYEQKPDDVAAAIIRYDRSSKLYYKGLFDSIMPDLNYNNPDVREEIKNAAGFWLDKGVDGFRLDAAIEVGDDLDMAHEWWNEFGDYVYSKNPSAFIVGENWSDGIDEIAPFYADMNSSFDFLFAANVMNMANGIARDYVNIMKDQAALFKTYADSENSVVTHYGTSTMLTNHDMDRIMSRLESVDQAKLAASMLFTLPGTPFIYYGDELGQIGPYPDDNRREPFDWYKSAKGEGMTEMTSLWFNKSKYTLPDDGISYEEQNSEPSSILNHYKRLISIRNEYKELYSVDAYKAIGMSNRLYAYTVKGTNDYQLLIVHNQSSEQRAFSLKVDGLDLYTGREEKANDAYELAAYQTLILKYKDSDSPVDADKFEYVDEGDYSVNIKLTIPENTPMDERIYISGLFNRWDECDEEYFMERTSQTTCEITLTAPANTLIEYKFTRGSWDMREQNADGEDLVGEKQKQNREYIFEENEFELNIEVERWSDLAPQ